MEQGKAWSFIWNLVREFVGTPIWTSLYGEAGGNRGYA